MGDRVYPYLGGVLMNVYLLVELLLGVLWFLHYLFFFAFAFRFNVAALQADMKMIYIWVKKKIILFFGDFPHKQLSFYESRCFSFLARVRIVNKCAFFFFFSKLRRLVIIVWIHMHDQKSANCYSSLRIEKNIHTTYVLRVREMVYVQSARGSAWVREWAREFMCRINAMIVKKNNNNTQYLRL